MNVDTYLSDNYLVLDFEGTNLEFGTALNPDNHMILAVWRKNGESKVIIGGDYAYGELINAIEQADFIVAHNAKHELQWLQRMGYDVGSKPVFDTMLAEYVISGNRRFKLGLGACCVRYGLANKGAFIDACMRGGVCPSLLPQRLLLKRCALDVYTTEQLFLLQRKKLIEDDLLKVVWTRCWLTPVLADIEFNGMHLDEGRVSTEYWRAVEELEAVSEELDEFTGGINPRSPKQVGEYLYDVLGFDELVDRRGNPRRTAAGGRLTDANSIEELTATTGKQVRFKELKSTFASSAAELSKTLEFCKGVCDERGGIFHGQFNQSVTQTHRLSSSGRGIVFKGKSKAKSVQFQNFPRRFKKLFSPRQVGWKMVEVDGAQLEFRVAAYLGRDTTAYYDITHGVDVHQFTADTLTTAGQPTTRQGAKQHTFKPLYGGESGTPAEVTYYDAFKAKYTGVAQTQMGWKYSVLGSGRLITECGLRYYWPDTKQTASGYITNSTAICNYPVQGLATAEIIPIAVGYLWREMRERGMQSFLINTIHDSVIAEVHPDEIELFKELAVKCFTTRVYEYLNGVYDIQFSVPLGAGCKVGNYWGEGEEVKYEPESPYQLAA